MPLLTAHGYLAGLAVQLSPGQVLSRRTLPPRRSAAAGTGNGLAVIRPRSRVQGEILLQQPGRQFARQRADTPFALGEGDGRRLLAAVEVEIEGSSGLLEPLLAELFTGTVEGACLLVHGGLPRRKKRLVSHFGYRIPPAQLQ